MSTTLQPASVINDLRTKAHLQLSARLQSLDLTALLVMTLGSNLPTSIIPYLIWQFDMMVPAAPMETLGVSALTILQNALPLHQILGTPAALKQALALCGYPGATLLEGQASWGGTSYPTGGWAVYRVVLASGQGVMLYSQKATAGSGSGVYTLPSTPLPTAALRVFYNGLLQNPDMGYAVSGTTLTLYFAPDSSSTVAVAMLANPLSYLQQIITFFQPARCYLDAIESTYPSFFDAITPTVSGSTLTLPETPATLELFRNGLYQTEGVDYTISGAVITLEVAPGSDVFLAWGSYGANSGTVPNFATWITPSGLINGTNTVFTLPEAPTPAASLQLYLGWQLLEEGVDYTLSGATITYTTAPVAGSTHYAFYRY